MRAGFISALARKVVDGLSPVGSRSRTVEKTCTASMGVHQPVRSAASRRRAPKSPPRQDRTIGAEPVLHAFDPVDDTHHRNPVACTVTLTTSIVAGFVGRPLRRILMFLGG